MQKHDSYIISDSRVLAGTVNMGSGDAQSLFIVPTSS